MNNKNENTGTAAVKSKLAMVEEKFDNTKEKVSDKLSAAAGKVHEKSDSVQDYLDTKTDNAEDFVREKAYEAGDFTHQTIEKANKAGHRAAEALEHSSEYVRKFDVIEAKNNAIDTVKRNPEIGIAAAGIFGLVFGWLIGRRSR
ncbi:MAG: hypothetical protein R2681_15835 [Pyrinomonadaceae bacterium]